MNSNSAQLTSQIFKAKLLIFLRSHLSEKDGKVLEQLGKNYGEQALLDYYLSILKLRAKDLNHTVLKLFQESQELANSHVAKLFLANPQTNTKQTLVSTQIKTFFSQFFSKKKPGLNSSKIKQAKTTTLADNQDLSHSFSTLSQPIVDDLVTLKVWDKIKQYFSQDEQKKWKKKLNSEQSELAFQELQAEYEKRANHSLRLLTQEVRNETVTWLVKILISSVTQTQKTSRSGQNAQFLKLLEEYDFAGLVSFHQQQLNQ